jgi:hypothetical protein
MVKRGLRATRKPASDEGKDAYSSLAGDIIRSALVIGAELSKVRL